MTIFAKILLGIFLGIPLMVFVVWGFEQGIRKSENVECIKWQEQAQAISIWYATHWQVEQCKHYGVDLSNYAISK